MFTKYLLILLFTDHHGAQFLKDGFTLNGILLFLAGIASNIGCLAIFYFQNALSSKPPSRKSISSCSKCVCVSSTSFSKSS